MTEYHNPSHPIACHCPECCRRRKNRQQANRRMARLRERRGAAVSTSISLPPEIHEAASRLLAVSRRGRSGASQAHAYLVGVMMAACAGQRGVHTEMAAEMRTIKSYLSGMDIDC